MSAIVSIGIDLGTSNCALSVSTRDSVEMVTIPQITGAGRIDDVTTFASAVYFPYDNQFRTGDIRLPWNSDDERYFAGNYAREIGAGIPDRLITSAKSWLCQGTIDPADSFLPWESSSVPLKLSPREVTRYLLSHLLHVFTRRYPDLCADGIPEDVQVVVTVPASFDEAARTVTAQAAIDAGWGDTTILLEEPQAAFYSWLDRADAQWRSQVSPGEVVLICDVGGGTTDFSLIAVGENDGNLELDRISVGRHVLLGGDNMDLALAYALRAKLEGEGETIEESQFLSLIHTARKAKETLFNKEDLRELAISVASTGSDLFAGTVTTKLERGMLDTIIRDGFFPLTAVDDLPVEKKGAGLREFGLSYESDPVISKHLAQFLTASCVNVKSSRELSELVTRTNPQRLEDSWLRPDAIVFNGGVFRAASLRRRVIELLTAWAPDHTMRELPGADLDLAVARGAALYGRIKQTREGIRIRAGVSRSYYIGLDSSAPAIPGFQPPVKALCVAEQGMEEGEERVLEQKTFGLAAGATATFRFFSSATRAGDTVGTIIQNAERELEESTAIEMHIPAEAGKEPGYVIPVHLHSMLTELGMLRLWIQDTTSGKQWEVTFNVRTE